MFTITKKANSANVVWDAEKDAPLLIFKGGVFITSEASVAKKAEALGYVVESDAVATEQPKKRASKKAE